MSIQNLFNSNPYQLFCANLVCDDCGINGNVSWYDCDAQIAHIGNLYSNNLIVSDTTNLSSNVYADLPQEYGDHLVFFNTTTKKFTQNHGFFTQTLNVTWTSSNYGFEVTGKIIYNIVGNAVFYQLIFDPYIYFQTVANLGYWELPAGTFPIPPSNGNIYTIYINNGPTYGQQPCLLRVFDNGGASIQYLNNGNNFPTTNTETLSIYNYAFVIVNQV